MMKTQHGKIQVARKSGFQKICCNRSSRLPFGIRGACKPDSSASRAALEACNFAFASACIAAFEPCIATFERLTAGWTVPGEASMQHPCAIASLTDVPYRNERV